MDGRRRFLILLFPLLLLGAVVQSQHQSVLKKRGAAAPPAGDITTGLVGHWPLEEGTGSTTDDASVNTNVGTLAGTTMPTWIAGKVGTWALNFPSATNDNHVTMGDVLDFAGSTSFSVSAWSRPAATTQTKAIIGKKVASGANSVGYWMRWDASENASCQLAATGGTGVTASAPTSGDLTWHLVTMVVNRTTQLMTCYLDNVAGTPVDISTNTGTLDNTHPFYLGTVGLGLETSMQGDIDDVFVFNRILAPADICLLFQRGGGSC